MISESELEERLERARGNPEAEQEFFQYLLEATVYAHVPISDDCAKFRLIQFKHPDGFDTLPFFTSESKAAVAAGKSARIVTFTGRELLEITRGAILMLNPNDGGAVLYPEEIESLLATGTIVQVRKDPWSGGPSWFGSAERQPSWLVPVLTRTLAQQSSVTSAYLIQTAPEESPEVVSLLIVLGVEPGQAEGAARACLTSMQPEIQRSPPELAIDLTVFDPAQGVPDFVAGCGVEPFFRRKS
ncbi:enhanced serine sensitivity protein SseB C-terminal domain-containing protein [Luteimonas sp. MJ250]|uniref:enhanced serine sensitivity protein SseB C-terminal domain-containing protein n=1 Tax=Luteimonas sp. MJ250 TaxID=3129236 RepID=UPI0031BB49A0